MTDATTYRDWYDRMYQSMGEQAGTPVGGHQQKFDLLVRGGYEPGMQLLDFGCGPGTIAGYIHPERYFGVDISQTAIGLAKGWFPGHRFDIYEIGRGVAFEGIDFCVAGSVFTHTPHELVKTCLDDIYESRCLHVGCKPMQVLFDILEGPRNDDTKALYWPREEFLEMAAPWFELEFMETFWAGRHEHTCFKGIAK